MIRIIIEIDDKSDDDCLRKRLERAQRPIQLGGGLLRFPKDLMLR